MRWPKIFAILPFAKINLTKISTVKNLLKISHLISDFDFPESLNETNKIIENFNICQKCEKYTGIFDIRLYMSKIDAIFLTFSS